MATIVSIINYKGGVGKTASTFNIGAGLRFLADRRVLLIDLDPQCSLSTICLKAYSRLVGQEVKISDLEFAQTLNSVIKAYLLKTYGVNTAVNIDKLVLKSFYRSARGPLEGFDVIPATMFDTTTTAFAKGLDDLEIELAMRLLGPDTRLHQLSLLAQFLTDSGLADRYDYVLIDCPPANNLLTQNALIVSDYYLIPTIMDDMSSNGISHLDSLIQNTIFARVKDAYASLGITDEVPYFAFFEKTPAKLLGIFETLRKTNVDTSISRNAVKALFGDKLLDTVIYNHVDTARDTGQGLSIFTTYIDKDRYSPYICYGDLVIELLDKIGVSYNRAVAESRITRTL